MVDMIYSSSGGYVTEKLGGFKRLQQPCRLYLVVAAVTLQPIHWLSLQLLKDDRFLKFGQSWGQGVNQAAEKVVGIDIEVWDILASVCPAEALDGCTLRSRSLHAMHTGIAYLYERCFRLLDEYPLRMTQGCVSSRIEELRRMADADIVEPLTRKIWLCLRLGVGSDLVRRALLLLRDAPCSTQLVEKSHASAAILRRQHQRLGVAQILLQSTCILGFQLVQKHEQLDPAEKNFAQRLQRWRNQGHFSTQLETTFALSWPARHGMKPP